MMLNLSVLKKLFLILFCFLLFSNFWFAASISHASIDDDIAALAKQIADLEASMAPLQKESTGLQSKISSAKIQITKFEAQIADLGKKLIDRESDLEVQKTLLSERVRQYYINTKKFNPLMIFLASAESSSLLRQFTWSQAVIGQDRNSIIAYVNDINALNASKTQLEAETVKLAAVKKNMESRFGFLANEIKKAQDYKNVLSARQQSLIAEKNAMFNTSVGDASTGDDPASRADYNPGFAPAFAAFSFGAPHRNGMSQYGALARAQSGQGTEEILHAYYGGVEINKNYDTSKQIHVLGCSLSGNLSASTCKNRGGKWIDERIDLETYTKRIYETPSSWGDKGGIKALEAQAVAARSYVLSVGGEICPSEDCQVYKSENKGGNWETAVNNTKGWVMQNGGKPLFAKYASTSGGAIISYSSNGYSTPMLWDTKCGSLSCWPGEAFEKSSGSPWFYKGWYKTRSNVTAGRSHPWLTNDEFSDIINAILYFSKTNDSSHLSQIQNCLGSCDASAWSKDELRRQVGDKGGPVSSINSISVDYSTGGYTQTVHVGTDKGNFDFSGGSFKDIFTLRAPGALTIKSSLFNIEKK